MQNHYLKYMAYGILSRILPRRNFDFPKTLDDSNYVFAKHLKGHSSKYQIGIYTDTAGRKFIAKMWSGITPNILLFWLKNEAHIYKVLNLNKHADIPKLYLEYRDKNRYLFLLEMIPGKALKSLNLASQLTNYTKAVRHFSTLKIDSKKMTKIGPLYYSAMIPILVIRAFLRKPSEYKILLSILLKLPKYFKTLFTESKLVFNHRDLDNSNILLSNSKIYIIDFQISGFTIKGFDIANIYVRNWKHFNQVGYDKKLDSLAENLKVSVSVYTILKIFCVLYDLAISHEIDIATNFELLKIIC